MWRASNSAGDGARVGVREPIAPFLPAAGFVAMVALAEGTALAGRPVLAVYLHGALLIGLILGGHFIRSRTGELVMALTVVPLLRLFPLTVPVAQVPVLASTLLGAGLLVVASMTAGRALGCSLNRDFGWNPRGLAWLPALLALGAGVGVAFHAAMRPGALVEAAALPQLLVPAGVLAVAALAEELYFRGLLLTIAVRHLGTWPGIVLAAIAYAGSHLVLGSIAITGAVLLLGVVFGWIAHALRSMTGVAAAHAVAAILTFLVLPHMLSA